VLEKGLFVTNYLICPVQNRLRNRRPDFLGGFEIDDNLELRRLLRLGGRAKRTQTRATQRASGLATLRPPRTGNRDGERNACRLSRIIGVRQPWAGIWPINHALHWNVTWDNTLKILLV